MDKHQPKSKRIITKELESASSFL